MLTKKIKQFFIPSVNYLDNRSFRRVLMTNFVLIAILVSTTFFFFLNLYMDEYLTAAIDFFGFFISIYGLYQLQVHHDLQRTSLITTASFILFFLLFVYFKGNDHFGLIWSIFVPIIAFSINGKQNGLYFSLGFYTLAFFMAYINIGIWDNGAWGNHDFLRFFFASNILVYMLYMHERALEKSDFKLIEVRAKEKEYIEKLHQLSITDPLTTLYNRRYFNEVMPKVISIAKRNKLYLTFFILDVDFFKHYNDYYGHIAGDKALIAISDAIKKHVQRHDDFVFRFGGEEFGGVILSEDPDRSQRHAESILKLIEGLKIEHKRSTVSEVLTVSIGIATVTPAKIDTIEALYLLADQELYNAKENGRNQCCTTRVL